MARFQKLALATTVALLVLILAGAIVRATGAGLGCPDWPTCWGCLIPPTHVDQVDMSKIDMEKFQRKAAALGRDPTEITPESLKAEFDPVLTWTEYINRLLAMPLSLLTLGAFIAAFWQRKVRPKVFLASIGAIVLVLANALLGAWVVYSGLAPGVITAHLALALLMLLLLIYMTWAGTDTPWRREVGQAGSPVRMVGAGILILTLVEGVMGAQVRELTDQLALSHLGEERSEWIGELEGSVRYLIHRSFSWVIVLGTLWFLWVAKNDMVGGLSWLEKTIGLLVFSLMVMGLILSQVGILQVVQVLHVFAASLLVSALVLWILASKPVRG